MESTLNVSTFPVTDYYYLKPPFNIVFGVLFGFLIIFSVTGNFLVLMIILHFKRMRTRTNLLLANMSAIDLLTGLLTMPFSMITAFSGDWVLGPTACQVNGFLNALFISASIHTLMYISIHKYFTIRNVFKAVIGKKHIIGMMAAAWIWGFLFATALVTGWTVIEYKQGTTQCGPKVPDRGNVRESTHSIFTSVSNFAIPLLVITFCYASIFWTFRKHIADLGSVNGSTAVSPQQHALIQQKKIAVTLIIVLIGFLICVLPYIAYSSAAAFARNKESVPRILNPVAYLFLYLSSCINPVIYALRSAAFRKAYKSFFRFLCCRTNKKIPFYKPTTETHDNGKATWRRFSTIIHDALHLGSHETPSSRQSSFCSRQSQSKRALIVSNSSSSKLHSSGLVTVVHPLILKTDSNEVCLLAGGRQGSFRVPSTIPEERTSQMVSWENGSAERESGISSTENSVNDNDAAKDHKVRKQPGEMEENEKLILREWRGGNSFRGMSVDYV